MQCLPHCPSCHCWRHLFCCEWRPANQTSHCNKNQFLSSSLNAPQAQFSEASVHRLTVRLPIQNHNCLCCFSSVGFLHNRSSAYSFPAGITFPNWSTTNSTSHLRHISSILCTSRLHCTLLYSLYVVQWACQGQLQFALKLPLLTTM